MNQTIHLSMFIMILQNYILQDQRNTTLQCTGKALFVRHPTLKYNICVTLTSCNAKVCQSEINSRNKRRQKQEEDGGEKRAQKLAHHTARAVWSHNHEARGHIRLQQHTQSPRAHAYSPLPPPALLGASRESSSRLSNLIVINARGQNIHARSELHTYLR